MAGAYIRGNAGFSASAGSVPVAYPADVAAGNLLVVAWGWADPQLTFTIGDTLGTSWSTYGPFYAAGIGYTAAISYGIAPTSGPNTVTIATGTTGMTNFRVTVHEYSGVDSFDIGANAAGSSAALNSGSATTTHSPNSTIFGWGISNNGVTAADTGAGFTLRQTAQSESTEDKNVSSLGSYNATFPTVSSPWTCLMAAFYSATATPSVNVSEAISVADVGVVQISITSIGVSDLEYHGSGASNLGGPIAGVITGGATNNVWDDVTSGESASGDVEYRCIYIKNAHPTTTWIAPKVWIDTQATPDTAAIALDSAAVGSTAASTSANETTAPTGGGAPYTFTSPTTKATGLQIADIPAGQYKAVWLRRTVPASSAANPTDAMSVRCEGSTP